MSTPQDAEAVAFLAVEQHCIVSPHLRGPDSKDFRRQLIAKYREAVERRVRAEERKDAALRIEELPRIEGRDGMDTPYIHVDAAIKVALGGSHA